MDPCDVHFNVKTWIENTTWHNVGMEDLFAGTRCGLERLVDELKLRIVYKSLEFRT